MNFEIKSKPVVRKESGTDSPGTRYQISLVVGNTLMTTLGYITLGLLVLMGLIFLIGTLL